MIYVATYMHMQMWILASPDADGVFVKNSCSSYWFKGKIIQNKYISLTLHGV